MDRPACILGFMIPPLDPTTGALPPGRYRCSRADFEAEYVAATGFSGSNSRKQIFEDFLSAHAMLSSLVTVEAVWIGGSFVTSNPEPDDIDCLFHVTAATFHGLPSNSKRNRVMEFNKKGNLRTKTGLRVEPFVLVRELFANPWEKSGVTQAATPTFALRGAWDDWWQRASTNPDKNAPPALEDVDPVKGYLEVIL